MNDSSSNLSEDDNHIEYKINSNFKKASKDLKKESNKYLSDDEGDNAHTSKSKNSNIIPKKSAKSSSSRKFSNETESSVDKLEKKPKTMPLKAINKLRVGDDFWKIEARCVYKSGLKVYGDHRDSNKDTNQFRVHFKDSTGEINFNIRAIQM